MRPEQIAAVEDHLGWLSETSVLERAPLQVKALAAMVQATQEGRDLTGAELAQEVYGRTDERYVRAVRQLARELRLKVPLAYEPGRPYPIRFELHPNHYSVIVVASGGPAGTTRAETGTGEATAARGRDVPRAEVMPSEAPQTERPTADAPAAAVPTRRRRWTIAATTAGAVALLGIAAFGLSERVPGRLSAPARVDLASDDIVFLDASNRPIPGWRERIEECAGYPFRADAEGWIMESWAQAVVLEAGPGSGRRIAAATCDPFVPGRCALLLLAARGGKAIGRFDLPLLPDSVARDARLHEVEGETFLPDWSVSSIGAGDFDGDGIRDEVLVNVRLGRVFPSEILVFDHDDGDDGWQVLADYWNMGSTKARPLDDLDGDGRDEILIWGENNSLQRGIVTLLPSAAGFPVGARSPDGERVARLAEVEHYPYAGITLQFPFTDLVDEGPRRALRNAVLDAEWDGSEGTLHVTVADVAVNPDTGTLWKISFQLTSRTELSGAFFLEYDSAFAELRRKIARGDLQDRWNVEATQRLTDYGRDLASRVLVWDARERKPQWRPIQEGEFEMVFPIASAVTARR